MPTDVEPTVTGVGLNPDPPVYYLPVLPRLLFSVKILSRVDSCFLKNNQTTETLCFTYSSIASFVYGGGLR